MAFADNTWYCNGGNQTTTGYYAVAVFVASAVYAVGQLVRQAATPPTNSERVFVVTIGGTAASTEPAWILTRGSKTVSGTVTFQECTGSAAMNGDLVSTPSWNAQKSVGSPTLGAIIKRNNSASYQICTTAGTMGSVEPAFSDTAGVTTTEVSATSVWTSLGPVANFLPGLAPHARLIANLAAGWCAAGHTVFVAANHAESAAGINLTPPGNSAGLITKIICHNNLGSYPPAAGDLITGASISSLGANAIIITVGGSLYIRGLTFMAMVGSNTTSTGLSFTSSGSAANQCWSLYENCSFQLLTSGASSIQLQNTAGYNYSTLINCKFKFNNTAQYINVGPGLVNWFNTAPILESGSIIPVTLFNISGAVAGTLVLEGLDLSQITASIVTFFTSSSAPFMHVLIKDCKLGSATPINAPAITGPIVQLSRSSM